ncbi:hypothetical protein [Arthrobacter sp. Br18]|uniref:hypothetical protein n=1 Tax=Arthrobacter sp. Br18 TaxID=1312954 RepID=UPI00047ECF9D|nr:hypothetical protein [Arthrobacter sp. Br18]
MNQTIVVLTEEALTDADALNLQTLQGEDATEFVLLVPEDRATSVVGDFLHHLSLLELAEAFRSLSKEQPAAGRAAPVSALEGSLETARQHGLALTGRIVAGSAVKALVAAAQETDASQAVVITRPHAVADTFHRDWANQAQDQLGIAVLHLYSGSGFIGGS